ncbi:unnamed protein product [Cylindrotheca closterium]|uniref:Flavoprotein domain-containing protein n=1 Tax=Cylindrotheca closterium TaxID=2856 RepID=A0AAD2FT77_9STRA|nr:unnamed protein product [Cylindrotheca closterium]
MSSPTEPKIASSLQEGYQHQHTPPNILLAVTGSVAAIKCPEIAVRLVKECKANVKVLLSQGGKNFWDKSKGYNEEYWDLLLEEVNNSESVSIIHADDEWKEWNQLGDPVLHIDLRDWADLMLVAPLSAHTLAKLAHGFCDDTVSCVVRAWDFGHGIRPGKPLLLAPAMNTAMWQHPLTLQQLDTICGFWNFQGDSRNGIQIVEPQEKKLACGEIGNGALASVDVIIDAVRTRFNMKDI